MGVNKLAIREALSFYDRLLGLMFQRKVTYGLLFQDCRSIHTFFMRTSIGVMALDKNYQLVALDLIKPGKVKIYPKHVCMICEIPVEEIAKAEEISVQLRRGHEQ